MLFCMYDCEVCYIWLSSSNRHRVTPGWVGHSDGWTWPWDGEWEVGWGPHGLVVRLRLITYSLPGQPPMYLWKHQRVFPVENPALRWKYARCSYVVHMFHALKLYMNIHAHYVFALSHTRDSSGMDAKCAVQNLYTEVKRATHDSLNQDLSGSWWWGCWLSQWLVFNV